MPSFLSSVPQVTPKASASKAEPVWMSVPVLLLPELLSVSVLLPESVSLQQPVLKNHIL